MLHDHEALQPEDVIIRRIAEQQISNYPNGVRRISSLAFKTYHSPSEGMSVDLERFIREDGMEPRKYVTTPVVWFLQLRVGGVRDGLLVGYDPTTDNPYHGQIWNAARKRTSSLSDLA